MKRKMFAVLLFALTAAFIFGAVSYGYAAPVLGVLIPLPRPGSVPVGADIAFGRTIVSAQVPEGTLVHPLRRRPVVTDRRPRHIGHIVPIVTMTITAIVMTALLPA